MQSYFVSYRKLAGSGKNGESHLNGGYEMLEVIFYGDKTDKEIIRDGEMAFAMIECIGTETDRNLMKFIDKAEYLDTVSFIDRFGCKLYYDCLSTGCRTAIAVEYSEGKAIDTVAMGWNALEAVFRFCRKGAIYTEYCGAYPFEENFSIDVLVDGRGFTDMEELNRYLESEEAWGKEYG